MDAFGDPFTTAVAAVAASRVAVPTAVKLQFYGLYKQATAGDAGGARPPFWQAEAAAKYDAWAARRGTAADAARAAYVHLAAHHGMM